MASVDILGCNFHGPGGDSDGDNVCTSDLFSIKRRDYNVIPVGLCRFLLLAELSPVIFVMDL